MRIKQIELNGFKSFMQRTALELPQGVTAIVGPNGCGKSNIVDAIRWVLGEQSPKHLRGAAMEDVIFNGNSTTGPMGMAEVSLLLERDERELTEAARESADEGIGGDTLPPELAQASEILVTRRYFRSGESEYFINRAPCRLRDITELFLGTGVGTRAYAIIEQGRVDQLVNAKPEDLRLFIEEAAGTTRFRSRRIAAERKMERTRDNLLRVQDVLRELERQVGSLERQARRAEEYHRIKGELRDLDLRVMAARQRAWTAEAEQLSARVASLLEEEAQLQEQIRRSRGTTSSARVERAAKEERLRVVEADITDQRLAAGEAGVRAASLHGRRADLIGRVTDIEAEVQRLLGRQTVLAAEAERLEAEVDRLAKAADAAMAEQSAATTALEQLADTGEPLEQAAEEAKAALLDALAEEVRVGNVAEALRQRREELSGRRRKLDEEQRTLGERLRANAVASEAAGEAMARLDAERNDLVQEKEVRAGAQAALAAEESMRGAVLEAARAEHTQLRSRAESLRELTDRYEGCTRGVGSLLGRGDAALLASMLRVPAELERAVAAALGARLTQVVVPDTTAAVRAIGWLRETNGGSASVVPRDPERRATVIVPAGRRLVDRIEVEPQHWALAEALLGGVLLADTLEEAVEVWRAAAQPTTVVTLAGEAIDALGTVTGGSEPPLEETLLARARELRELETMLGASAGRVTTEERELAVVRHRAEEVAAAAAGAADRLQAIRVERVACEKDRERLEAERARISAELEVGALEAGGLAGEDGQVARELAALDDRRARATKAVAERREELVSRQARVTQWREQHMLAERRRSEAAVQAAAVSERAQATQAEASRCRAEIVELAERLATQRRQSAEAANEAGLVAAEAERLEQERAAAQERVAALGAERAELLAGIAVSDQALASDDAAERAAQERLGAVREERGSIEVTTAERRLALEHLVAQLRERYDLGPEVLADVQIGEDGGDGEDGAVRAENLRARLVRLGDVNPGALEELRELNSRRDFLVTQRADLESSLDDLRRTIAKLARTSRQRFEATFEAANEKLALVFPKLFPGGKARLELTEPEDGGEPGVEIVVQPEGKKLQSLSLLSGGEKALTAVGLILSLFLIRPTPFCLLDEVDAPLDEANIGRFNQLIRDMASASQFMLITHNRRTMEVADTLYGITMEQAGVSKVVSVRLREAA